MPRAATLERCAGEGRVTARARWRLGAIIVLALIFALAVTVLLARSGGGVLTVGPRPSTLLLDDRTGRLFVASGEEQAVRVVALPGFTLLRTTRVGIKAPRTGAEPSLLALDRRDGHLFVANESDSTRWPAGTVSMLDSTTGALLHVAFVGGWPESVGVDERLGRVYVTNFSTPTITALDSRRGTVIWTRTLAAGGTAVAPSMAVDTLLGHLLVLLTAPPNVPAAQAGASTLLVLDARSGRSLRSIPVGRYSGGLSLDARTRRLFVLQVLPPRTATLAVLDAGTGRVVRRTPLRGGVDLLVAVERAARLFAYDRLNGTLRVVDARSGALRGTVMVGRWVWTMAADERAGYLLLARIDPARGYDVLILDARSGRAVDQLASPCFPTLVAGDVHRGRALVVSDNPDCQTTAGGWAGWLHRRLLDTAAPQLAASREGHLIVLTPVAHP